MPTYDYVCEDCSYAFEHFQTMTSEKLKECPKCRGRLQRKIGAGAALIFKGPGFYCTDYRKERTKSDVGKDVQNSPKPTSDEASRD